jgi:uncharacterized membrane protein YfcA
MDPLHILLIVGAGIIGGVISSMAGGASLFTFPAILAVGLPPTMAVAVTTTALTPSLFLATFYDRAQLPPFGRPLITTVLVAICGGFIGGALLLLTPQRMFEVLVPMLLTFATVLLAFAPRISRWLAAHTGAAGAPNPAQSAAVMLPVSIYGGYFGVGLGVLVLGVLSIGTAGNYRSANVTKNLVTGCNSLAAVVIFATQDALSWPAALLMTAGTLTGSLFGARLAQVLPNTVARAFVIAVGVLLTTVFTWRYWF